MATFYVKLGGTGEQITTISPGTIDPGATYIQSGTGAQFSGATILGSAGNQQVTPPPSTAPTASSPATPTLPAYTPPALPELPPLPSYTEPGAKPTYTPPKSNLAQFSMIMGQATDLARKKFMDLANTQALTNIPFGALPATSFAQLVGNLGKIQQSTTMPLIEQTLAFAREDFENTLEAYKINFQLDVDEYNYLRDRKDQILDLAFKRKENLALLGYDQQVDIAKLTYQDKKALVMLEYDRQLDAYDKQLAQQKEEKANIQDIGLKVKDPVLAAQIFNSTTTDQALKIYASSLAKGGEEVKSVDVRITKDGTEYWDFVYIDPNDPTKAPRTVSVYKGQGTAPGGGSVVVKPSEGFFDAKIESDAREDANTLLTQGKTPEEAYQQLRLIYSPQEISEGALKKLVGITITETSSLENQTTQEAANSWLSSGLTGYEVPPPPKTILTIPKDADLSKFNPQI